MELVMKKLFILMLFALPLLLYSAVPTCVAGMEVSLIDANGKVVKSGKINSQGRLTLSGISNAPYDIKLTNNNKSIVLDKGGKGKVRIDKSTPLLMKASLSDYQDGDDLLLRKRPGRIKTSDVTLERSEATKANINTSRSNIKQQRLDEDSDNDGIGDDCDDAEITITSKGSSQIEILVSVKNK